MDRFYELNGLRFEWDEEKYSTNLRKHGVKFEEGAEVFFDEEYQWGDASVENEHREFIVGFSFQFNLLYTVFVERRERIRIISARRATNQEERFYAKRK